MIGPSWFPAPAEMRLHLWAGHCSSALICGPLGCMGAGTVSSVFLQGLLCVWGILSRTRLTQRDAHHRTLLAGHLRILRHT